LTTHELPLRHEALGEVEAQSFVVVVNEVQHNVEVEAHFNELARVVVAHRLEGISITITAADEVAEDVALVGRTMISHNETAILL
jgi:hypothetical protein